MDQNPPVTGIRALAKNLMLERATNLLGPQALEVWRVMRLLVTHGSLAGLPGAVLHAAVNFNQFPEASEIIREKALDYERNSGTRQR
jgi:hypothetical protein